MRFDEEEDMQMDNSYFSTYLMSWMVDMYIELDFFFLLFFNMKAGINSALVIIDSQNSAQCLAHSKCSINIFQMNDNLTVHKKGLQDQEYIQGGSFGHVEFDVLLGQPVGNVQ